MKSDIRNSLTQYQLNLEYNQQQRDIKANQKGVRPISDEPVSFF